MKNLAPRALTFILALGTLMSALPSAQADDFNHRNSRDRRRGDYRRGFGDGTECARMKERVRQALIWELERTDRDKVRRASIGSWVEIYQLTNSINVSPATRYLASQAMDCERERHDRFDSDVDRESEEWHRRNPDPVTP